MPPTPPASPTPVQLFSPPTAAAEEGVREPCGEPGGLCAVVAAGVRLYRDGIAAGLSQRGVRVPAVAADMRSAAEAAQEHHPDVLLLDVAMPDARSGVRRLAGIVPSTRVVALAVDEDREEELVAWAEAGVAGWVGRESSTSDLVDTLRRAARGELACSARLAALLTQRLAALAGDRSPPPAVSQLTPREREVAGLLTRGMSNKSIARSLSLRLATVKNHVHSILDKLDARNRSEVGARLRDVPGGWHPEDPPGI